MNVEQKAAMMKARLRETASHVQGRSPQSATAMSNLAAYAGPEALADLYDAVAGIHHPACNKRKHGGQCNCD